MTTLWISSNLMQKHEFIFSNDPPTVFFFLSGFYSLMKPLFPSAFLEFYTSNIAFTPGSYLQLFAQLQPGITTALFLSKIPYLLFDIASAFLMLHLFDDKTKSFVAFKIWLIFPVGIYVTYMVGQFDIFAVFFIILSLYLLKKHKFSLSTLSLGLSGLFKIIGIALLPFTVIYFWKITKGNSKNKIGKIALLVTAALLPLVLFPILFSIVPQFYESVNFAFPRTTAFNGFFGNTFYTRGTAGNPLFSGLLLFILDYSPSIRTQVLLPDFIYFIPLVYTLILLAAAYQKNFSLEKVYSYFTIFLLLFYAFSLFHVQWFLWIQPFLIMLFVENRKVFGKLVMLIIPLYFIYVCYWDAALTVSLLAPIFPKALFWPGPVTLMNNAGLPGYQVISIFRTVFSAICIFIAFNVKRIMGQELHKESGHSTSVEL